MISPNVIKYLSHLNALFTRVTEQENQENFFFGMSISDIAFHFKIDRLVTSTFDSIAEKQFVLILFSTFSRR